MVLSLDQMEWDWRDFYWEMDNLSKEDLDMFDALVGSSSLQGQGKTGEILVAQDNNRLKEAKTASSPAESSRNDHNMTTCSVDGCKSDLSNCKDYHRRHKVCERHSKTPVVIVRGEQKRFCQQCSRFHSLGEFDEVKRSCRKRLDGHNRRRRKPHPESIYMTARDFTSNFKGPRILQFGNPEKQAIEITRSTWACLLRTEAEAKIPSRQQWKSPCPSPSDCISYGEGKKTTFPLTQSNCPTDGNRPNPPPPYIISQPHSYPTASSEILQPGETSQQEDDSGRALYLLSSNTSQSSGIGLSCLKQSHLSNPPYAQQQPDLEFDYTDEYPCLHGSQDRGVYPVSVLDENRACNNGNMLLPIGGPDSFFENEALPTFPIFLGSQAG